MWTTELVPFPPRTAGEGRRRVGSGLPKVRQSPGGQTGACTCELVLRAPRSPLSHRGLPTAMREAMWENQGGGLMSCEAFFSNPKSGSAFPADVFRHFPLKASERPGAQISRSLGGGLDLPCAQGTQGSALAIQGSLPATWEGARLAVCFTACSFQRDKHQCGVLKGNIWASIAIIFF